VPASLSDLTIRPAYSRWAHDNERLRDRVASMTEEQLAIQPSPERWPLWATIGHLACQRVFGLCDIAGEPGAETTPFPNASYDCPGDDDLEHVLTAAALVEALDSTFRIIEGALDRWTPDMLAETVRHREWGDDEAQTRGEVLQRSFAHDIWHIAELNEALRNAGLPSIDIWD
jgi:DinB superfamily